MTRDYPGRRGAPRPPRHIEADMEEAGRTGDRVALLAAQTRYLDWLETEGFTARISAGWAREHETKDEH